MEEGTDLFDIPYNEITKIAEKHGDNIKDIALALNISFEKLRYILYYNHLTQKPRLKEKYRNIALAIHKGRYYYYVNKTLNQ